MAKWTANDIPALAGKTAVVTGANSGLGYETALELARHGADVVLACRDERRGTDALERLRDETPQASLELALLDLADLASVRKFAEGYAGERKQLDILVNNAGVMALAERRLTADGFEMQFGTNHLGHFALTGLLLPQLQARSGSRVVSVTCGRSSSAYSPYSRHRSSTSKVNGSDAVGSSARSTSIISAAGARARSSRWSASRSCTHWSGQINPDAVQPLSTSSGGPLPLSW